MLVSQRQHTYTPWDKSESQCIAFAETTQTTIKHGKGCVHDGTAMSEQSRCTAPMHPVSGTGKKRSNSKEQIFAPKQPIEDDTHSQRDAPHCNCRQRVTKLTLGDILHQCDLIPKAVVLSLCEDQHIASSDCSAVSDIKTYHRLQRGRRREEQRIRSWAPNLMEILGWPPQTAVRDTHI